MSSKASAYVKLDSATHSVRQGGKDTLDTMQHLLSMQNSHGEWADMCILDRAEKEKTKAVKAPSHDCNKEIEELNHFHVLHILQRFTFYPELKN